MSHDPVDWNQWQALSRQYFDTWRGMARNDAAAGAAPAPSLTQPFEQWSQLFAGQGGAAAETMERIVDSVKNYAAFMQAMLGALANGAAPIGLPAAFAAPFAMPAFNAGAFSAPQSGAWTGGFNDAAPGFLQTLAAMANVRPPAAAQADATAEMKSWLNLPAFGLMREHQEHHQQAARARLEYQQQMSRYNALMLKASQRGFEQFQSKLASREEPGRQVDSLRGLYDLWVEAAEEGYAEVALSVEFREAYAALVNAQMRVRASVHREVERVATDLGLPTRSEIDTIGKRLQALRREVRGGKQLADSNIERELARLRHQVDALTKQGPLAQDRVRARDEAGPAIGETQTAESGNVEASSPARKRKSSPKRRGKRDGDESARVKKSRKSARGKRGDERAIAAAAPGSFASRIARFADASLGASRPRPGKTGNKSKSGKSGKNR